MIRTTTLLGLTALFAVACPAAGMTIYTQTQSASIGGSALLTFTDALPAASDATLELIATGSELALNGKRLEQLMFDGVSFETPNLPGGHPAGSILPVNFLDVALQPVDPVTIPLADLMGFVADGQVEVSVTKPGFLRGAAFDLVLTYTSSIPEPATGLLVLLGTAATLHRRGPRPLRR